MINMAVINLKDIIKYLVKLTIVIAIIVGVTRYFSSQKSSAKNQIINLQNLSLINCIDEVIPAVKSINNTENKKSIEAYKVPIDYELAILGSVEKNEENKQEEQAGNTEQSKEKEEEKVEEAKTGLKTEVLESNVPNKYSTEYNGVKIRNETDYKLTKEILRPDITLNTENILIFHTHTCESYTASEKYQYKQTGNFRTTDRNYSVVRVGRELEKYLKPYGYNIIHDESYHDYPSYNGSYTSSLKTVTELLEKNKNTDIVLDLHRDAIGDNTYAPTVKIGDEYAAQLMFVIGGNGSTIKHEDWQQNLKFAVKIQEKANELYPGLFKPIILRYSGYNQHVAKGAAIIEIGATGNTLDQCLVSMKYLAKVIDEALK